MSTVAEPARPGTPPLSRTRKLAYGIVVALVAVVVFFGGLELALRIIGFGHSPRFYRVVREDGQKWLRENRWFTSPYFPPELIRRPQAFRIPATKAPGTYRVFVLGSSAAMGDPEPAFSMSRMLEVLLRNAYPAVRFEVVNAGITAINSHVVRAVARDCAELQPDLYIVYEGHNEVIGPYGPGTVFSPFLRSAAAIRLGQAVKETRTGQLAAAIAHRVQTTPAALRDWGGMRMFLDHQIDRDDPRLTTTAARFRENLTAITNSGRRAGATVFLCTVLTNEKDFAPFQSRHRTDLSGAETERWNALFTAGEQAARAGDDATAEMKFRAALAIDDHFAELPFQLGRLYLREKRPDEAKVFLQEALDLDALRFRTDSRLNDTIRALGATLPAGAEVVDLAAEAARQSPQGILGDEFLYEHVHLNFQGTYVVARDLFPRITADLVRRGLISPATAGTAHLLSMSDARYALGYTLYEQAMIIKELRARFAGAPFTAQSDNPERQRLFAERDAAAAQVLSRPHTREGLVALYEAAVARNPDDWMLQRNVGMAYVGLGMAERARPHLEHAVAIIPDDPATRFALATAERDLGDAAAAARNFAAVRALEPDYPGLPSVEKARN